MSNVSFTAATERLDNRMLRDIGVQPDGVVIDPRDPRYRRIVRPANLIDRLLTALSLSGGALFRA